METTSQLLGGLGALGILGAVLLGGLLFFILPWCAIIECVRAQRSSDSKAVLVVLLVLTWGLGSLIYGLFLTSSRALRRFTVFALLAPLVLLIPSILSFATGASIGDRLQQEKDSRAWEALEEGFKPGGIDAEAVEPFMAVQFVGGTRTRGATTLAWFTLGGAQADGARNIDSKVKHIAYDWDNERCFALTSHDFGTITPSSGRFTRIEVDPSLRDFSWPKGIALNRKDGTVIIMTSHVYTRFFVYDPQSSDWSVLPVEIRDLPLQSLTYSPDEDCLYALESDRRARSLERIHRFNTEGASLGTIKLQPPVPVSQGSSEGIQLHYSSGKLLLLLPATDDSTQQRSGKQILAIDPESGEVFLPE